MPVIKVDTNDHDELALDVIAQYLAQRCGPGLRVNRSDCVRHAIHAAANLCAVELTAEQGASDEGQEDSQ